MHMTTSETYATAVHALSGAAGGVVSRTATAPADRVRTLLQAGLGVPLYPPGLDKVSLEEKYGKFRAPCRKGNVTRGTLTNAIAHIYREGGWRGFYRGNGTNCVKVAPDAGVQFAVNRLVAQRLAGGDARQASLPQRLVSGGVAGAASQTLIHPIDVVKTQMTVAESSEYTGLVDCLRRTAQDEGLGRNMLARFYRGYWAALLGIVPYMATKLGTYTYICDEYRKKHGQHIGGWLDQLVATGCSFAAITVAYPCNLARVKLQTQGVNGRSVLYGGVLSCWRETLRYEGVKGLYRGFVPNLVKALPAQSILLQVQWRVCEALLVAH